MANRWLGSEEGRIVKTVEIPTNFANYFVENGRKIVKSGTLINHSVLGYGFLLNDADITDSARLASIMIRGEYINAYLPISLSTSQKSTLAGVGLREVGKSPLNLYVKAVAGSESLLGKTGADLQSNILVGDGKISGVSKYVTGYTGFSGDTAEQSGNYVALVATAASGATIKAQIIGGLHGEVTLDPDGILVARIVNTATAIRYTATLDSKTEVVEFSLKDLVKQSA